MCLKEIFSKINSGGGFNRKKDKIRYLLHLHLLFINPVHNLVGCYEKNTTKQNQSTEHLQMTENKDMEPVNSQLYDNKREYPDI